MIFLKTNTLYSKISKSEKDNNTLIIENNNRAELNSLEVEQAQASLTNREQEVLYLISEGFRTGEIAKKLFISPLTVSTHRKHMIKKLRAKTTPHLVGIAIRFGLI